MRTPGASSAELLTGVLPSRPRVPEDLGRLWSSGKWLGFWRGVGGAGISLRIYLGLKSHQGSGSSLNGKRAGARLQGPTTSLIGLET